MNNQPHTGGRVLSIDILRGFTLIAMAIGHFLIFYGDETAVDSSIYFFLDDILGDWGAAGFLMMMGMSQVLSSDRMGKQDNRLRLRKALVRGGFLFVVGLAMLLLVFGPDYLWIWDILTLMGVATLVLFFLRSVPSWLLLALVCGLALATPWLRGMPFMAAEWSGGFEAVTSSVFKHAPGIFVDPAAGGHGTWQVASTVKGFFLSGDFPVLPWIAFSITGFVLGRRIVDGRMKTDIPFVLSVGVVLVVLGFWGAYVGSSAAPEAIVDGYICAYSFYPDSFTMILHQMGMVLIVFGVLYHIFDVRRAGEERSGRLSAILIRTSKYSLSFYVGHYVLIGWPLAVVYAFTGQYLIEDLMGPAPALLCGLAAVVVLEAMLIHWDRTRSTFNLESLLARIMTRVVKGYQHNV